MCQGLVLTALHMPAESHRIPGWLGLGGTQKSPPAMDRQITAALQPEMKPITVWSRVESSAQPSGNHLQAGKHRGKDGRAPQSQDLHGERRKGCHPCGSTWDKEISRWQLAKQTTGSNSCCTDSRTCSQIIWLTMPSKHKNCLLEANTLSTCASGNPQAPSDGKQRIEVKKGKCNPDCKISGVISLFIL